MPEAALPVLCHGHAPNHTTTPPRHYQVLSSSVTAPQAPRTHAASRRTPCIPRVFDALPPESRTARVQLLLPHGEPPAAMPGQPAVVHLAATGDHGFDRRQRLAKPLLQQVGCWGCYAGTYASWCCWQPDGSAGAVCKSGCCALSSMQQLGLAYAISWPASDHGAACALMHYSQAWCAADELSQRSACKAPWPGLIGYQRQVLATPA